MARVIFMHKSMYTSISTPVEELSTLVFNHFGKAPMGWTGIDKLTEYAHNEQFVDRILRMYKYLKKANGLFEGINPSQFYKIIYKFQLASKSLSLSPTIIQDCYFFLANYAIRLYNYNVDCIQHKLSRAKFVRIEDKAMGQKIAMFSALLRSYSETVYCDEHTIAGEIYSPIYLDESVCIARHYSMLDASLFRSELKGCPVKAVRIYTRYNSLTNVPTTDIVGNLLITDNILPYMDAYNIEIDDRTGETHIISVTEAERIIDYFFKVIPELANNYKKKNISEKLWIKILCEYFALKPFCDAAGIDWSPTPYAIEIAEIANPMRPIVRVNEEIASLEDEATVLKKLIELNDPRIHY